MNRLLQERPATCRLFSLSLIGGEGRGEGARRAAKKRGRRIPAHPRGFDIVAESHAAARFLTLTLSPDGGEGTCHWPPQLSFASRFAIEFLLRL